MPVYEVRESIDGEVIAINIEMDSVVVTKGLYDDVRGPRDAARKVVEAARDVFGDGIELARNCAARVVHGMKQMDEKTRPDEFEVQFAIKLDSEVGAILAKFGTEAQLQVTMKWKRQESS